MGKIRVLNQQEIMSVLDMQSVIEAVKKHFITKVTARQKYIH